MPLKASHQPGTPTSSDQFEKLISKAKLFHKATFFQHGLACQVLTPGTFWSYIINSGSKNDDEKHCFLK